LGQQNGQTKSFFALMNINETPMVANGKCVLKTRHKIETANHPRVEAVMCNKVLLVNWDAAQRQKTKNYLRLTHYRILSEN
jgi:hypothetical protein